MPRKSKLEEQLCQEFSGTTLREFLAKAHLPCNYPVLSQGDQALARKKVLTSWFDIRKPHILCTNTKNFLAAMFLWVEYYIKPDPLNVGVYYFADPLNKYDMVNLVMGESKDPDEPNMSLCTATRRTGKTQTLVIELIPFIAIIRPFTKVLMSQINDRRTGEEMVKIQEQVEDNERIHTDFGGKGQLFPRKGQGTWGVHHLKFIHHPGSEVLGHSLGSAQRGRGPIFGVIDDPEDESNTYNRDWRRSFFAKLFHVYKSMFTFGGKFVWIGTPIHSGSCLSLAMRGHAESEKGDESITEKKFRLWRRGKYAVITRGKDGGYVSNQPERITVPAFLRKLEIDPITTLKEIMCEPITPGTRAFEFDSKKHGYMHCQSPSGEYFLDLYTGEEMPWKEFLASLRVMGAGDLADGQSEDSDPGALAYVGVNPNKTLFILDAFIKKCFFEKLVEVAYIKAEFWECEKMGWEKAALQSVINRMTARYVEELRKQGKSPPVFRELDNANKNKIRRILTMRPLFTHNEIRFLYFEPVMDPDGRVHTPVEKDVDRVSYTELLGQVMEFTDEGLSGDDDGVDSLEMAVRLTKGVRGLAEEVEDLEHNDKVALKWQSVGLNLPIPVSRWTKKMYEEAQSEGVGEPLLTGVVPFI